MKGNTGKQILSLSINFWVLFSQAVQLDPGRTQTFFQVRKGFNCFYFALFYKCDQFFKGLLPGY